MIVNNNLKNEKLDFEWTSDYGIHPNQLALQTI